VAAPIGDVVHASLRKREHVKGPFRVGGTKVFQVAEAGRVKPVAVVGELPCIQHGAQELESGADLHLDRLPKREIKVSLILELPTVG
jgi:hypothetical protein